MDIDIVKSTNKLEALEQALAEHKWETNYSLYSGKCGYLFFLNELSRFRNAGETYESQMSALCDSLFEDVQQVGGTPAYCNGLAGVVYTLNYLGLGELTGEEIFEHIRESAEECAQKDNFDFLYGCTGMINALSMSGYNNTGFYNKWMELLESKLVMHENGLRLAIHYKGQGYSQNDYQYNYSLSHGMASVLITITGLLENKHIDLKYETLAEKLIDSILAMRNEHVTDKLAFYPSIIKMDNDRHYLKRISWCYGDFGIAIMLNRYRKYSGKAVYQNYITEILDHYLQYKNLAEIGVKDADFCHGAAGTALMYLFFYQEFANENYKEAAVRWYNLMLQMDTFPDGVAGYKHYDPKGYFNSYGLLEGVTGIGLTLITFLSGKKLNWQSCFLIQ